MELGYVLHTTIHRSNYYEYFMKKVHSSCKELPLGMHVKHANIHHIKALGM